MICPSCGSVNDDGTVYCRSCGRAVTAVSNEYHTKEIHDIGEVDRDSVIRHLCDLRALEIAKNKLEGKINGLQRQIPQLGIANSISKPTGMGVVKFAIILLCSSPLIFAPIFNCIMYSQQYFEQPIVVALCLTLILYVGVISIYAVSRSSKKKEYKNKLEADARRVDKEEKKKSKLINECNKCKKSHNELINILNDTYSLNIVPAQFRNVYGVCYLYDYMSTSRESLQSAFINYQFNVTNERISYIINQQSDMIMQQYIQNAHLEAIQKHNRNISNRLDAIESNTAVIAGNSYVTAKSVQLIEYFERCNWLNNM